MTRLLLDYPWELDAARGPDPAPQKVIQDFLNLLSRTGLDPVPFVEHQACEALFSRINQRKDGRNVHQLLNRFLKQCVRHTGGSCRAAPNPEPPNLRDSWKCALREELDDLSDWRNPQIIVPRLRRPDWRSGEEIRLHCEQCGDNPASGPHRRILAVLEHYESHPFAISDLDPWDLQRIHPPDAVKPRQHPCILPRPPILVGVSIEDLHDQLKQACAEGWEIDGKYYFLPPKDLNPLDIDDEAWRHKGHAFRYGKAPDSDKSGPIDNNGIVWSWDEAERHWDVQTKPKYMRISHTGKRLPDPS